MNQSNLRWKISKIIIALLLVFHPFSLFAAGAAYTKQTEKGNFMGKKLNHETTVFVTGASSGIGLAVAERLAKDGFRVVASARSPENSFKLLALAKEYPNLLVKKLDVTDNEENIHALMQSIGHIDILINNAGFGIVGAAESMSVSQIQHIFETNVLGVVKVTNAALPIMRAQNSGLIITISSIVGPLPSMQQCFYSGSKAMVEHYTSQLKNDLKEAGYNIAVANIHPGPVLTNFETAAAVGQRFENQENPYPQMETKLDHWRAFMREGRPVFETVETILNVIHAESPPFWNPTESRVYQNFADVYSDPAGERF